MAKFSQYIKSHKIVTSIIVILLAWGAYRVYGAATTKTVAAKYVVQNAVASTIVVSVSGSGQMAALNTIDIKPQNTAVVTSIPVKVGDHVKAGQLLVQLDATTESRALAQAKLQYQSAQLSLAKLTQAPATSTLIQDQNAVAQAETNVSTAAANLSKDYQDGFDSLTTSFVDLQTVMAGLQNFVLGNDVSKVQSDPDAYMNLVPTYMTAALQPYHDDLIANYNLAATAYQTNLADYHGVSRSASPETLDALFSETARTAQNVSEAVKAAKSFLDYIVTNYPTKGGYAPLPSITNTLQTNMGAYTNTISGTVGGLSGVLSTITSDKNALTNADLALNQASSTLATLLAGADPLDVQSSQVGLAQQQLAVQTAEENLADDSIRAPVDGVVASIPSVVGATVASPAVSMVGNGQVADITLNEVDAAKVKVGDKATLTFSAISGLSLAGQVVEIDPVGTVSQGVVSYNASIALASPNDTIKPGMSVSANIVTDAAQNTVVVPSAAVTTQNGTSYILVPASPLSASDLALSANGGIALSSVPNRIQVATGLSNSTQIQIVSGLNAGDQYVAQTVGGTSSSRSATTAASGGNAFRVFGGGGIGGGR